MTKIKAIIFDLGNVLIKFDHTIAARKLSKKSPYSEKKIHDLIFDSEIVAHYEIGKIKTRDFFRQLRKILKLKISDYELRRVWNEIFSPNSSVERLVKKLKKRFCIILLSNINFSHYAYLKKRFSILKEFNKIILSFREKVRKPHPEIYKKAIKVSGCLPQEIIYIDDREDLVSSAEKLGINSLCFKGVNDLKKNLGKYGINSL